ncbi:hypothetical protein A3Q56_04701 [Intoshia linei]|uniref:Uncharacterized protein n=1 Tax=Intoshia linei TaxID=1819745 RepID=A0A177B1C7_9BILA|nr:hypothetical protein A3Q56_04701 [Intoshia linei]
MKFINFLPLIITFLQAQNITRCNFYNFCSSEHDFWNLSNGTIVKGKRYYAYAYENLNQLSIDIEKNKSINANICLQFDYISNKNNLILNIKHNNEFLTIWESKNANKTTNSQSGTLWNHAQVDWLYNDDETDFISFVAFLDNTKPVFLSNLIISYGQCGIRKKLIQNKKEENEYMSSQYVESYLLDEIKNSLEKPLIPCKTIKSYKYHQPHQVNDHHKRHFDGNWKSKRTVRHGLNCCNNHEEYQPTKHIHGDSHGYTHHLGHVHGNPFNRHSNSMKGDLHGNANTHGHYHNIHNDNLHHNDHKNHYTSHPDQNHLHPLDYNRLHNEDTHIKSDLHMNHPHSGSGHHNGYDHIHNGLHGKHTHINTDLHMNHPHSDSGHHHGYDQDHHGLHGQHSYINNNFHKDHTHNSEYYYGHDHSHSDYIPIDNHNHHNSINTNTVTFYQKKLTQEPTNYRDVVSYTVNNQTFQCDYNAINYTKSDENRIDSGSVTSVEYLAYEELQRYTAYAKDLLKKI